MNIVIIGNSIAGISCAEELRKLDNTCSITVISEEDTLPYDRTRLLEQLFTPQFSPQFFIRDAAFYSSRAITLIKNKKAASIDTRKKRVKLDDDTAVPFDKLLLATGTVEDLPDIKGITKRNIFGTRTLADIKGIKDASCIAHSVFFFGDFPGMTDAAARFASSGNCEVFVVSRDARRPEGAPEMLRVIDNDDIAEFIGEGEVQAVKFASGKVVACSLCVAAGTVKPNLRLVKASPVTFDRGIVVDAGMKTSVENIAAAGDCAQVQGEDYAQGWQRAREQGIQAARSMVQF